MSTDVSGYAEELFEVARDVDLFAAIDRLYAEADPDRAAQVFGQLAKRLYTQDKRVARSSAVARAGIQYCLYYSGDAAKRNRMRQWAKSLAYNLAANCWPGWGDDGIEITPSDLELALDAARLNVRLALELSKGPLAESKGHWLMGALLLAQGKREQAGCEFTFARERARLAEHPEDEQMNAGYEALVGILQGEASAHADFRGVVDRLSAADASEDARFYGQQLKTALTIFQRS
jgi:hypothetical protein